MNVFLVAERLPPDRTYVLVHYIGGNWHDGDGDAGCEWKVAKFVSGLSLADREAMPEAEPRKRLWNPEDEFANNRRPYCWKEFGPGSFFGQDVDRWYHLPKVVPPGETA